MRKFYRGIGIAAMLAFCGAASAQITYSSAPNLAIPDNPTVSDTLTVTGGTSAITGLTVSLNITHTFDADLDIALVHNGQYLLLTTDNGGLNDNYTGTIFDDAAATVITAGTAPFTGSFRPEGGTAATNGWAGVPNPPAPVDLSNLAGWIGQDANGPWQLIIDDDLGGDVGVLIDWSITVSGSIGGPTPPFGLAASSPSTVTNCGGETTLLTVTVTPGTLPASTGLTVTGNLSNIGGSASQTLYDNGTNGDATANDNVFSYLATVPNTATAGSQSIAYVVADAQARSTNANGGVLVTECPPVNDTCGTAIAIGEGTTPFNTTTATNDEPACAGGGPEVYFSFTPSTTGAYQIDTCGSGFDTVLRVTDGCGGSQVGCVDDSCGLQSSLTLSLVEGIPYIIQCDSYNTAGGAGVLNVGVSTIALAVTGNAVTAPEMSTVLLRATVTPGSPPPSTGVLVTGDLSSIGGSSTQSFYDDGTNGDVTPGDNIFSYSYTLPITVVSGAYPLAMSAADDQSRSAFGTLNLTVSNGPNGACCNGASCSVTRQTLCVAGDGTWGGAGTNCGGNGYSFASSSSTFEDISASGTILATISDADDATETVSLPFTFNHLGNAYTSVNVSSNGNLQFGASNSTAYVNVAIPNTGVPNDMLAPAWDDYDLDEAGGGQGTVYYLDDSANGRVVFSWQGCSQFLATPLDDNNFQVILYSSGNVEFRYGAMNNINNPTVAGDTVTIGYENSDGTFGGSIDPVVVVGSGNVAQMLLPGVTPSPCGPTCDTIDFNGDGLFPDTQDITDFIAVFGGATCPTGTCNDIDYNNDGLFPDTLDITALISVFGGGECLQ